MAFLWIIPLAMRHQARHVGDGQCAFLPTPALVEVRADGAPLTVARWQSGGFMVDISAVPPGATLEVNTRPEGSNARTLWPVSCEVEIAAGQVCSVSFDSSHACTISNLGVPPQNLSILCVFLSRLRDVTTTIANLLEVAPSSHPDAEMTRQTWSPLWQTPLPSRGVVHYTRTSRPSDSAITLDSADISPPGENLFFEVCGTGRSGCIVPRLLSVYWPQWVPRAISPVQDTTTMWPLAEPTPYLIFYHPNTGQAKLDGNYLGAYPESFDYLFFIHWANHNYTGDPLAAFGQKGIPYQIARSRAHSVLVIPCLYEAEHETGRFNDGDFIVEVLEEIQASVLRKAGIFFSRPSVGRVGLAGFSAGTQLVATTIGLTRGHPFASRVLKEVYMLDPHIDDASVLRQRIDMAESFLSIGSTSERADKMARIYTQISSTGTRQRLQSFLGRGAPSVVGSAGTVRTVDSADGLRTAAILPSGGWPSLDMNGALQFRGRDPREVHQLIPSLMITDALSRSGFAKEP